MRCGLNKGVYGMVEEGRASQNTRDKKKSRRQLVRGKAQREKINSRKLFLLLLEKLTSFQEP